MPADLCPSDSRLCTQFISGKRYFNLANTLLGPLIEYKIVPYRTLSRTAGTRSGEGVKDPGLDAVAALPVTDPDSSDEYTSVSVILLVNHVTARLLRMRSLNIISIKRSLCFSSFSFSVSLLTKERMLVVSLALSMLKFSFSIVHSLNYSGNLVLVLV